MFPPTTRSRPVVALAAAIAVATLLLTGAAAAAAGATIPSRILPGSEAGSEVTLRPAALRADDGRAHVEVALGQDAPGDVVVDLSLVAPAVATDGTVTPGPEASTGRITSGGRVRPGEVLRASLTEVTEPLVVLGAVRPAGDDPGGPAPTTLQALVLPGDPGPAPATSLEVVDGQLRGEVRATTPLLVTARLSGAQVVIHPERLVLPGQPLVLSGEPAPWPVPSELAVSDEAGRTVVVSTPRTALSVVAAVLVAAAVAGLGLLWRRRRATRA